MNPSLPFQGSIDDLLEQVNLKLAREFMFGLYEYQSQVIQKTKHFLCEDIVFHFAGDPDKIPFAGRHLGIDAAEKAWGTFFKTLRPPEGHRPEDHYEFFSQDDDVVVWGKSWMHPPDMPLERPVEIAVLMQFNDGQLASFDNRFNAVEGAKIFKDFESRENEKRPSR